MLVTGMQKGMEKGMEKGREEGEKQARLAVAKNLLSQGFDIEMIIQVTKLTKAEIEALR
jgi:predicted transposase/invertase (TIGR01784 family)